MESAVFIFFFPNHLSLNWQARFVKIICGLMGERSWGWPVIFKITAIITRQRGDIIKYINQIYMQSAMSVLHTLYLSKAQLPDLLDCVVFWPWACLGLSGKKQFRNTNQYMINSVIHISQLYGFPVEFEMDTDTTNTIYLHSSSWPSSLTCAPW